MNRRKFIITTSMGITYLSVDAVASLKFITTPNNMKELRLILTVDNLDELIDFYKNKVGLKESLSWNKDTGRGIILEAGKSSLELIDRKHKDFIDKMEVGITGISGDVRIAMNFGALLEEKSNFLLQNGARKVSNLTKAPWSNVMRVKDPSGMQITLFDTSTLIPEK